MSNLFFLCTHDIHANVQNGYIQSFILTYVHSYNCMACVRDIIIMVRTCIVYYVGMKKVGPSMIKYVYIHNNYEDILPASIKIMAFLISCLNSS